jgi:hypothetical protein
MHGQHKHTLGFINNKMRQLGRLLTYARIIDFNTVVSETKKVSNYDLRNTKTGFETGHSLKDPAQVTEADVIIGQPQKNSLRRIRHSG